jgi:ATP-dependent DNA ligase
MSRAGVPRSKHQYVLQSPALQLARELPGIKPAAFPGFIEPLLATLRAKAPSTQNWAHEIKLDGYRTQIHIRDRGIQFFTRRGNDWSDRFTALKGPAGQINTHAAIIDGEVIVQTAKGSSDFGACKRTSAPAAPIGSCSTPSIFSTLTDRACGTPPCSIASGYWPYC